MQQMIDEQSRHGLLNSYQDTEEKEVNELNDIAHPKSATDDKYENRTYNSDL